MRKQNRPNQSARKQMQNLTVELFARDKNSRFQLLEEALSVSSISPPSSPNSRNSTVTAPVSSVPLTTDSVVPENIETAPTSEISQDENAQENEQPIINSIHSIEPTVPGEAVVVLMDSGESNDLVAQVDPPDALPELEEQVDHSLEQSIDPIQEIAINSESSDSLACAQRIAEEEREEVERRDFFSATLDDETPPPLQRVPYEAEASSLASIRAAAASMNIAAVPIQPEPMSFAACVRKMPSIESMSLSPSPYAKFDGKSNPFASGGSSGGGGFSRENKGFNTNPFANRRRFDFDSNDSPFNSGGSSRFPDRDRDRDRNSDLNRNRTDSFSSLKSGGLSRGAPRGSDSGGVLPTWWKTRSFSSASSHYPQSQRPSSGSFPPSSKNMTTLNIPTHGHVEDLDGYLVTSTQSSNTYFGRRSDLTLKKERWARMKAKKRLLRRPVEDEFYEDPDIDEEILRGNGVMLNQIVQQGTTGNYEDADLLRKFRRDVAFVKEQVLGAIEGNIDGIRDFRFLLASVQTYGNIDGECMMAELALNEFSLFSGIVEKFHSIVGPWQTENEAQRRRASRHAFETHRIPLHHNIATITKRKLVEEILGRTEPSIACHQGVKVGLYSDSCEEKTRVELNIKNNFKDSGMLCDKNDRRFILVLQSEIDLMVESMKHLARTVGLKYEGFPVHHNRFVIVEAFVEAISDIMGEKVDVETMRWFSLLGQKVDTADAASPWESGTGFHCARHSEPKSNFCAAVTVGRTCTIVYHVLGTFFRRYHLKKIPTANMISPAFTSM